MVVYLSGRGRYMALSDLRVGQSAILESLELPDNVGDHLAHLGFLPGANVEVLRRAPVRLTRFDQQSILHFAAARLGRER